MNTLFARHAWVENAWTNNVRLHWNESGDLTQIELNAATVAHEITEQFVLPGMVNLHSHAFQRAMAGMTEIARKTQDDFWSWRNLMYRFALAINPDQLQAIAAQLYSECLRHGYTSVCEFHYLLRTPDGHFYDNMAETAHQIMAAAQHTGIGITMLPVLYSYSDFNQQALRDEQRRFASNPEQVLRLIELLEPCRNGQTEIGAAPHSLRAASTQQMAELVHALPADRPIHIHIAEQKKEVESCLVFSKKRPVELLFETQEVNKRWCLVHATHLTINEINQIAKSNAVVGICTSTEGNLGDGFFSLPEYLEQQGCFGIGSDSHVSQSPIEELRWLEYGQRLRSERRNIASMTNQRHIGDFLWHASLEGGAQASGRKVGKFAVGMRADAIVLDAHHPNLSGIASADVFNSLLFSGNDNLVRDVLVGGQWRVRNGQHIHQLAIEDRFKKTMQQLRAL
jgi:formimidoylglutamate deiminase